MAGFGGTYWREGRDRKRGRGGRDDTHRTSPEHGDGDGGGGGDGDGDRDGDGTGPPQIPVAT